MKKVSWFKDHMRQVHMDFHMPEFPKDAIKNFDPKRFVDHLEHGRVNMVALFAKDIFGNSFYNTKVGHKHSGLEADYLLETAEECRRRGIRTLAYYSLTWDMRAWTENPAWRYIDAKGQPRAARGAFGLVCMNTPYKDEVVMPQLLEIAEYPVDGFFMDVPYPIITPCFCPSCKRKYEIEHGRELTPELPKKDLERQWMDVMVCFMDEMHHLIKARNPDLVICTNTVGSPHLDLRSRQLTDIGVWESQPRPGDYLGHSFAARTVRNDILDVQVMTVRFYRGWGDLTLKPLPQLTTEFAVMIGNGMAACAGDQQNVDGTLQPPVYDVFREAFGLVAEREDILKSAESVPSAAVLLPVPDPNLPFHSGMGREMSAARGAHKMLVESHIQVDNVYSVLADDLSRFSTVILPEPATYQPGMYDKLREYVRDGGTLIAVGSSLLTKEGFQLEDVFGIRYVEPLSFSVAHFRPADEVKGDTADIQLQFRGQAFKVVRVTADELAALYFPESEFQPPDRAFRSPFSPSAAQRSPYSFATLHRYGSGKAVYVAGSIFEAYWQTNHHWLRQFMEALIRHVDPTTPYEIDASGLIEANAMRQGDDLLLNLMHYSLGHQGGQNAVACIEQVHPVHNIPCRVRAGQVERVVLEPEGREIPFEVKDGVCSFAVPEVEYLAIVRIVGGASA